MDISLGQDSATIHIAARTCANRRDMNTKINVQENKPLQAVPGFHTGFCVRGGEYFVMLLPGTRSVPRGVRVTHATLGGSGGMLP